MKFPVLGSCHSTKPGSSTALMMEETDISETLVHFYQTTWYCNPQRNYFHTDGHHILISHFPKLVAAPQNRLHYINEMVNVV
jgi:hypothetical protein